MGEVDLIEKQRAYLSELHLFGLPSNLMTFEVGIPKQKTPPARKAHQRRRRGPKQICDYCGKAFYGYRSSNGHRFCSQPCSNKWQANQFGNTTLKVVAIRNEDKTRTANSIACQLGVSRERVRQILLRAQLPTDLGKRGKWNKAVTAPLSKEHGGE